MGHLGVQGSWRRMTWTGRGSESGDELVVGEQDGSARRFSWMTGGETMRWSMGMLRGWVVCRE